MKRSGFTMVELIFVIVIIGILAATALPKFGGVKDKAKINSELSAMSSMDGALIAKIEFQADDYGNRDVDWHDENLGATTDAVATRIATYKDINSKRKVLSNIAKKTDNIKIIGFVGYNTTSGVVQNGTDIAYTNDILILTNSASDKSAGISVTDDIAGKPDMNDFWVFNPNNVDLNVSMSGSLIINNTDNYVIVPSQSITLVDVNETTAYTSDNILAGISGTTGTVAIRSTE